MKSLKLIATITCFALLAFTMVSCINDASAGATPSISTNEATWHSIHDLDQLQKMDKKKVIVDVYTDWCKWCKVMDEKTFSDKELMGYLGENFHLIKFNAEEKSTIQFKGKNYDFAQNGRRGYNQLAATLCQDRLSYPSFVVLDENLNTIEVVRGFKNASAFKEILDKTTI